MLVLKRALCTLVLYAGVSGAAISTSRAATTGQGLFFDDLTLSSHRGVGGIFSSPPITFSFPQFDPRLGTLTDVNFRLNSSIVMNPNEVSQGTAVDVSLVLSVNGEPISSKSGFGVYRFNNVECS
jgi:hypothetical protein